MKRLTTQQRTEMAAELRRQYEAGATIDAIAIKVGRSYGWTHQILGTAGTVMRPRGGRR